MKFEAYCLLLFIEPLFMKKVLVTGAAGFIGYHLCSLLTQNNFSVTGIDSLNSYYDLSLKLDRVESLTENPHFRFQVLNICDKSALDELFQQSRFDIVINLAAQAGVRYSIEQPYKYADSNLIGFLNILEACRNFPVEHLLFASSSSVYGLNSKVPFAVGDTTDKPASLYAATKKANELMAYSYAHTYGIPCTGMRFFTVYGPYGRPDMAYFSFTKHILEGLPVQLYNYGKMQRDFTYIDDVVKAIHKLVLIPPVADEETANSYRVVNIGNNKPVELLYFVQLIEQLTGKKAAIEFKDMQMGDIETTYANIDRLKRITGFMPETSIEEGMRKFVGWYCDYYKIGL